MEDLSGEGPFTLLEEGRREMHSMEWREPEMVIANMISTGRWQYAQLLYSAMRETPLGTPPRVCCSRLERMLGLPLHECLEPSIELTPARRLWKDPVVTRMPDFTLIDDHEGPGFYLFHQGYPGAQGGTAIVGLAYGTTPGRLDRYHGRVAKAFPRTKAPRHVLSLIHI